MTIKGYSDKKKSNSGTQDYATLNPIREGQMGVDVAAHVFFQLIGADAAEALSTTRVIVATAHVAIVGDVISWTSGALNTREYRVAAVSTNAITVSEEMSVAPTAADTFSILRQKAPKVDSAGALSASFDSALLATAAKQDTIIASLASIDAGTAVSLGQKAMAASAPVVIASDQGAVPVSGTFWQATQPVSMAAVPTGAATETTLASIDAGIPVSLGQKAMAASMPVVLASDQASVPVAATIAARSEAAATPLATRASDGTNFFDPPGKGKAYADSVRYTYVTAAVTTAAWTQLIASTAADINCLFLFDSSGQTLMLGTGGAGSETVKLLIPPGGLDGPVPLRIPSGTRVAIKALSATTGAIGEINITGLT